MRLAHFETKFRSYLEQVSVFFSTNEVHFTRYSLFGAFLEGSLEYILLLRKRVVLGAENGFNACDAMAQAPSELDRALYRYYASLWTIFPVCL